MEIQKRSGSGDSGGRRKKWLMRKKTRMIGGEDSFSNSDDDFDTQKGNEQQKKNEVGEQSSQLIISTSPLTVEDESPLMLPTQTRLKVKIKRLKIVGEWRWVDGKGDNCGICRTSFEACCVDCKFPGDDCPLALGACSHAFHMHCILKWTNTQSGQKSVCPLCRQEWKFASS